MADIFISHTEEDAAVALALAQGIEAADSTTRYYERDSGPGIPLPMSALPPCGAVTPMIFPPRCSAPSPNHLPEYGLCS
jgi:hypothetical protein